MRVFYDIKQNKSGLEMARFGVGGIGDVCGGVCGGTECLGGDFIFFLYN